MTIKTSQDLANEVAEADAAAANEMALKATEEQPAGDEVTPSSEVNEYEDQFAELHDTFDNDEDDVPSPAEEEPAVVEETPETEEVVEEQTAKGDEVTTTTTEEPEETETSEVQVPEIPVEAKEPRTAEEDSKLTETARKEAVSTLTEAFKLSEEDEEKLAHSPNEVLPKMAANMYLDIFNSLTQVMQNQLPQLVTGILSQQKAVQDSRQAFYNQWPQLAKPEYAGTVERIANSYNATNQNATPEEAIAEIGAQAWVALKLSLDDLAAHVTGNTPQQMVAPVPVVTPIHQPAGPGNAPVSAKAPVQRGVRNEYTELAEEILDDDDF